MPFTGIKLQCLYPFLIEECTISHSSPNMYKIYWVKDLNHTDNDVQKTGRIHVGVEG